VAGRGAGGLAGREPADGEDGSGERDGGFAVVAERKVTAFGDGVGLGRRFCLACKIKTKSFRKVVWLG